MASLEAPAEGPLTTVLHYFLTTTPSSEGAPAASAPALVLIVSPFDDAYPS